MNKSSGLNSAFVVHALNRLLVRAWILFSYSELLKVYRCRNNHICLILCVFSALPTYLMKNLISVNA